MRRAQVSMKDIAAELGISKNAVSLALGNRPGVSQDLRERVLAVSSRMGYRVPQDNRPGEPRKLLIVTPEFNLEDRMFYSDVYLGIQKQAQVTGHFTMLVGISQPMLDQGELPRALSEHDFDGILCVGVVPHDYMALLCERAKPLVAVDNFYDDIPVNTVVTANEEGAFAITRHLLGLGHRDIGFMAPIENSASFFERWQGFRKAMLYSKVPILEELCVLSPWSLESLGKDLSEVRREIGAMQRIPSAFICGNDEIAMALIRVLGELGKSVPRDVSVAGFDDIDAARVFSPSLSTYRVPRVQLGQEAVRFLLALIADSKHYHLISKRALYGSLELRASTARPAIGANR